jgi:hypothetical protein
MKFFYILFLFFSLDAWALKPLEGIILGDVKSDDQFDPLQSIYDLRFVKGDNSEDNLIYREQLKYYVGFHDEGENLKNECESVSNSVVYSSLSKEQDATQSLMATLQYIGLDITTRAIGKYAQELKIEKNQYINLVNNLVGNYCSKNISVISLQLLKKNLLEKFFSNNNFTLPSVTDNVYFPENIRVKLETTANRKREMALTVQMFRSFCSWGGDSDYPRLLIHYLKNPYVMAFLSRNWERTRLSWNDQDKTIREISSPNTIQVACQSMLCRVMPYKEFLKTLPRMVGSTSYKSDIRRLYCSRYRQKDVVYEEEETVINEWIDNQTLDDINFEQLQFISLVTGVPDLLLNSNQFKDVFQDLKASIEQKWTDWAFESTQMFSKDLLYEEEVKVDIVAKSMSDVKVASGDFEIAFEVSQGEIDKQVDGFNKLDVTFNLYFSKDFVRWARSQWNTVLNSRDEAVKTEFIKLVMTYLSKQLDLQKDLFVVAPFDQNIYKKIAIELLSQFRIYNAYDLDSFAQKTYTVPVKFYYGEFALKYLRYKFKRLYRQNEVKLTKQEDQLSYPYGEKTNSEQINREEQGEEN